MTHHKFLSLSFFLRKNKFYDLNSELLDLNFENYPSCIVLCSYLLFEYDFEGLLFGIVVIFITG